MVPGVVASELRFYKPVQEPINAWETHENYQQAGRAFLAGLLPRSGAESMVNELPSHIARDIVELAKPRENQKGYGFIKNYTNKPIVFFGFELAMFYERESFNGIITDGYYLRPRYQFQFIVPTTERERIVSACDYEYAVIQNGVRSCWFSGSHDIRFNVVVQFQGEQAQIIDKVIFSQLMNLRVYKEGLHTKLEVPAPNRRPAIYYAMSYKVWQRMMNLQRS